MNLVENKLSCALAIFYPLIYIHRDGSKIFHIKIRSNKIVTIETRNDSFGFLNQYNLVVLIDTLSFTR